MNELPLVGDMVTYIGTEYEGEVSNGWSPNRLGVVQEVRPGTTNDVRVQSDGFVEWYPHSQLGSASEDHFKNDLAVWRNTTTTVPIKEMGAEAIIGALNSIRVSPKIHAQRHKRISLEKALFKKLQEKYGDS